MKKYLFAGIEENEQHYEVLHKLKRFNTSEIELNDITRDRDMIYIDCISEIISCDDEGDILNACAVIDKEEQYISLHFFDCFPSYDVMCNVFCALEELR